MLPKCLPIQLNEQIEIRLDTRTTKGYTIQTIQTEHGFANMLKFQLYAEVMTDASDRKEVFLNGLLLLYPIAGEDKPKIVLEEISILGLTDSALSVQLETEMYVSLEFKEKLLEAFMSD